jgi:chaperonin GroES
MKKDVLARGAASAQFAGGFGETDFTRNIYKGDETRESLPEVPHAPKAVKAFKPLGEVILVRQADAAELSTIIITETIEKDKPAEGTVLSIGANVTTIEVGQSIVFGKYAGTQFVLNGETLLLMEAKDVLGILTVIGEN